MLDKVKDWLNKGLAALPKLKIASGNMWLIYTAIFLLIGTVAMYIGTWVYFTFWLYKAGLTELKEIILILCGAPFIAALAMLRTSAVDKDGNGIADIDEKGCERNGHEANHIK